MKKKLLAGLMIAGMSLSAQTPRLSLYEEFTGETCPPCAATNPGLNLLLASPTNTPKIVAIKWQVPIPSAPSATWSLYQTNKIEIDWRWKTVANGGYGYTPVINSAPSSKIDGQEATIFGAASGHPANLNNTVISTAQSYTSAFSVTMARAWDATYSAVNLTISITASANFTAVGSLVFRTVMVEREIHFPTQPGTNGEKDFEDVAIKSFPTLQAGVPMAGNWTIGQTQTFTLNCPLPSYTRDKSEVAFVGFIQDDGNQKVAQAVRSLPDLLANDAKAISASVPMTCTNSAIPQITVKNNGSNAITGFAITPYLNGVAQTVYNWTGSLAAGASTTFPLNALTVIGGVNTFSYNISSVIGTDNNLLNNSASTKFIGVLSYQGSPVAEGFVTTPFPPTNWSTYNNYNGTTWIRTTSCGGFGTSSESTKLDFYTGVPNGSVNELMLPAVSFTGTAAPSLSFDVAYTQYNAADLDKLEVLVSTDCGATWASVYSASGSTLSTTGGAIVTSAFIPTANQWRKEVVALTGYNNMNLIVKFVGTSDYGNNLYLDNINLAQCLLQNVTVSTGKNKICKGESVILTASGASSYLWSNNATSATISVSPNATSVYTVSSNDVGSCKNSAIVTQSVDACAGLSELNSEVLSVALFPNPTSGLTNLNLNLNQKENLSITIMNSIGQVIYATKQTLDSGLNTLSINTENWTSGVYFVTVSNGKGNFSQKLTVSK